MKKFDWHIHCLVSVICLFFVWPEVVSAETIGLSPSLVDRDVYQGMTVPVEGNLSRSGIEGTAVFSVSVTGDPIVDLRGLTQVAIPEGEQLTPYRYYLITDGLALGEYEARLSFMLANAVDSSDEAANNKVEFGLVQKIKIRVVAWPDTSTAWSVMEYPSLLPDITVSNVRIQKEQLQDGQNLKLIWRVENAGDYPVSDVSSAVIFTQHGNAFREENIAASSAIPAGGYLEQSVEYLVRSFYPGGTYNAQVSVGESTASASAWVIQPLFRQQIVIISSGILALLVVSVTVFVLDRHRRRGRGAR